MCKEVSFPTEIRRIVLCGFMGAGKTTTGELLAARLGWRFLDVDVVIEKETGLTIAQIFAQFGEPHFRQKEHQTICRLLLEDETVLALGGGAIENPQTLERLLNDPHTLFIHLAVAMETVLARCGGTETIRPVFNDRERLQLRYDSRLPYYQRAHITIATDDIPAAEVADQLIRRLEKLTGDASGRRVER